MNQEWVPVLLKDTQRTDWETGPVKGKPVAKGVGNDAFLEKTFAPKKIQNKNCHNAV